jgi:hypothetical protein
VGGTKPYFAVPALKTAHIGGYLRFSLIFDGKSGKPC